MARDTRRSIAWTEKSAGNWREVGEATDRLLASAAALSERPGARAVAAARVEPRPRADPHRAQRGRPGATCCAGRVPAAETPMYASAGSRSADIEVRRGPARGGAYRRRGRDRRGLCGRRRPALSDEMPGPHRSGRYQGRVPGLRGARAAAVGGRDPPRGPARRATARPTGAQTSSPTRSPGRRFLRRPPGRAIVPGLGATGHRTSSASARSGGPVNPGECARAGRPPCWRGCSAATTGPGCGCSVTTPTCPRCPRGGSACLSRATAVSGHHVAFVRQQN